MQVQPWISANFLSSPHIIVENPPRTQLPPEHCDDLDVYRRFPLITLQTRFPGKSIGISSGELYLAHPTMPKKRSSMQSLFAHSFPTSPTSSDFGATDSEQVLRPRPADQSQSYPAVTSPRSSPPPAFLIDDDPFANLSLASSTPSRPTPLPPPSLPSPPLPTPRSPLTPSMAETKSISFRRPSSTTALPSGISRTLSGRTRPAYQKPAFSPRPSLPSLHTLAKMNVVSAPKVRKGRVGAKLPFEPWDHLQNAQTTLATSPGSQPSIHSLTLTEPSSVADFTSDLDSDFLDSSSDEDPDETEPTLRATPLSHDVALNNVYTTQFDLTQGMDSETSVSDVSPPPLSRTASSELSSLTRSTSLLSSSSTWSSDAHPSYLSHSNSMSSTESDSDILNSPPDDYLSFQTSCYPFNNVAFTNPFWPSHSRLDTTDLEADLHDSAFSDVSRLREPDFTHKPGTSADTIRPLINPKTASGSYPASQPLMDDDEVVDGVGWEEREGRGGDRRGFSRGQGSGITGRAGGGSDGRLGGSGRGRFGGRGDDSGDDEDDQRRNNRSTFSTPSDSEVSDETEDECTDDYGEEPVPDAAPLGSSDDDVPLAQRIPTALEAQRTIRRQVREERDRRRKERALRTDKEASARIRRVTLRPAGAGDPFQHSSISSSQEAALHASMSVRRPRTKTLPSNTAHPFSPEDLSRRLQVMEAAGASATRRSPSISVQPKDAVVERPRSAGRNLRDAASVSHQTIEVAGASATHHHRSSSTAVRPKGAAAERSRSVGRTLRDVGPVPRVGSSSPPEAHRALRPARSFHRPERRKADDHLSVPMPSIPIDVEQKLGRSLTRTRHRGDSAGHSHSHSATPHSLATHMVSDDKVHLRQSSEEPRKLVKANPEPKSTRPSLELERPSRPSMQRPPVPPLPVTDASISLPTGRGHVTQQRVFIGDMQRFNTVEIGPLTNGGDVIEMVEAQGSLKGWVGSGGWMVWEIAQDFGMARPIRNFELLADIQAAWNKDKMLNAFVIRLTPLAGSLSRSAIPSASPIHAGYVDWESKRGKWSKRWLQLREHNLYLAKRDNGRDEVFLCSLSNFDAYYITRLHKSPRPFAFAVRSTDNLSFFENTADYLHVFCCSDKEGQVWMEKILVARSYVLHQERNVLFNPKASSGNAAGGALARAGTRKGSSARPPQPLVAASPHIGPLVSLPRNEVFEPGSLLHKHI